MIHYLGNIKTIASVMMIAIVEIDKITYVRISRPAFSPLLWAVPVKSKIIAKLVKWVQWQTVIPDRDSSTDTEQPVVDHPSFE